MVKVEFNVTRVTNKIRITRIKVTCWSFEVVLIFEAMVMKCSNKMCARFAVRILLRSEELRVCGMSHVFLDALCFIRDNSPIRISNPDFRQNAE